MPRKLVNPVLWISCNVEILRLDSSAFVLAIKAPEVPHSILQNHSVDVTLNIINVSNMKKAYGTNIVLKGVDFQAKEGEVIVVIGKNGAGKSTKILR
ncbi:ATP-binding cassette domain-containing protein [Sporosarcina sp. BP05]|uniref:ATP-binding cassette domain-containing protein n=1 Tax=Sporosarcina sp. BP05 TaxID=2758726 RepID=UPI00351C6933